MSSASAPAKLILCGEHAVVYGHPAIALPLADLRAAAEVAPNRVGGGLYFRAPDLGEDWHAGARADDPLTQLAETLIAKAGAARDWQIELRSRIPIASGMGSGAAIATALVRALGAALQLELDPATISALVYESERHFHGTPSGIDNSVVAFEQAIWFERRPTPPPLIAPVAIGQPLRLVIGDSGVRSPTHRPVGAVRAARTADPAHYDALFAQIAAHVMAARSALASGERTALGALLNENQRLLEAIGVSHPALEALIAAARAEGALGAKLSGAGWGGIMFALAEDEAAAAQIAKALTRAGAVAVYHSSVEA